MLPQVIGAEELACGAQFGDIVPVEVEVPRGVAAVEEANRPLVIFELFHPDLSVAESHGEMGLDAQRVLVNGDDVLVGEDTPGVLAHVVEVVACHEGCGQHAPHREVALVFDGVHSAVAHFQHVGVVPVTRAVIRIEVLHQVDDVDHAVAAPVFFSVPEVDDVAGGPPEVADALSPFPGFGASPLADAEHDGASCLLQCLAHHGVGGLGVRATVVAEVVFQVIDACASIEQCILVFVAHAPRPSGAGMGTHAGIDAELKAFGVDVVGHVFHAVGEAFGVADDVAVGVAVDLPAVIDDDILVAGVFHARGHECVSGLHQQLFADVAAKAVPAVPSHGRGWTQGFKSLLRKGLRFRVLSRCRDG